MLKKILLILSIISLFTLSFSVNNDISKNNHQAGISISWPTRNYIYQGSGYVYPSFTPSLIFSQDIIITEISFSILNIPKGAVSDWGINISRDTNPIFPHLTAVNSEILGIHSSWYGSGGNWIKTIDLSKTPLYIAQNTNLNCFAPVFNAVLPNNISLSCSMKYHNYISGEPRYRSIRFPYVDMQNKIDGSLPETWYKSGTASGLSLNIPIGGWIVFTSFNGLNDNTTASNICIKEYLSVDGTQSGSSCMSNQILSINQNFSNSEILKTYTPNWYISPSRYITATCQLSKPGDCGIYLFILLRENIPIGGESMISGYDFVPKSELNSYCNLYASGFTHYWFGTTSNEKISNCNKIFDIVNITPTPTLTQTITPTITVTPTQTMTQTEIFIEENITPTRTPECHFFDNIQNNVCVP